MNAMLVAGGVFELGEPFYTFSVLERKEEL